MNDFTIKIGDTARTLQPLDGSRMLILSSIAADVYPLVANQLAQVGPWSDDVARARAVVVTREDFAGLDEGHELLAELERYGITEAEQIPEGEGVLIPRPPGVWEVWGRVLAEIWPVAHLEIVSAVAVMLADRNELAEALIDRRVDALLRPIKIELVSLSPGALIDVGTEIVKYAAAQWREGELTEDFREAAAAKFAEVMEAVAATQTPGESSSDPQP